MTTAYDLLARGYFPKELPPPLITADFANRTVGFVGNLPAAFIRGKRARLCTHNFARVGGLRRVLALPNPVAQYRLAVLVERNWGRIDRLIRRSKLSASVPNPTRDRALAPGSGSLNEQRIKIRAAARYVVTADVARFYHTIYTHTIPWAIHGKQFGKTRRGAAAQRLLGAKLDVAVADCQDGQTIGVPVGPDTSLVLAELVASAVDCKLQQKVRNLRGVRFIDDYELACRNRREADEVIDDLHIALAEFELALNPLKTSIAELPTPVEQLWKTPIRASQVRRVANEQATDLVALFDEAYKLARENRDKGVLAYTIGRLKDVPIASDNAALFQHLCLQCMLAEPGTAAVVLERLANNYKVGVAVNKVELAEVLNDQIVENARVGYASEIAWALWGTLVFDLHVTSLAAKSLAGVQDSVVALLALHSKARGLMHGALDLRPWQSLLNLEQLYGEHWLLAYEAPVKGWLRPTNGSDYIGGDANFKLLRDLGVSFYDLAGADPVVPPGQGDEPHWFEELEERNRAKRAHYGNPDDEVAELPDDLEDLF